jgi:tetratricopeptide (TPR) repeat protein
MPNKSTDALFQLIKSLEKAEKRNFKLYINRNSGGEDLKIVQLFDALDKMQEYDETQLLKNKSIRKQQLSNIKSHLYREILASLRIIKDTDNIDLQLHEQMAYARILYNKGLYHQSLRILDKMKEMARTHNQFTYLLQALFFEKKIEALHITRSMHDRAETLTAEAEKTNQKLVRISRLSNLSLQLYSWYIVHGNTRNAEDEAAIKKFFSDQLPRNADTVQGFYERLYLYQSYCWYTFIRQDWLTYYRYTNKWVELFRKEPLMIEVETAHYIKGMHNLLNAHFGLRNYSKFNETLREFEDFSNSELVRLTPNNRIQTFVYLHIALINKHFLEGTFTEGLKLVKYIDEKLVEYHLYLDRHRVLVFHYKIASLYFGSGDYERAIDHLNKIINWKVDLRTDLQCYSRLLHLIAHYELGNYQLVEYLARSVYRFMAKMEHISGVEEKIFEFLRNSFRIRPAELKGAFRSLLGDLKKLENNPLETRAFSYLDIVSWLESKISGVPVQTVIREKFLERQAAKA